jgi:hypothetical protein
VQWIPYSIRKLLLKFDLIIIFTFFLGREIIGDCDNHFSLYHISSRRLKSISPPHEEEEEEEEILPRLKFFFPFPFFIYTSPKKH